MPRFSDIRRNSTIHFCIIFIFGDMFPDSRGDKIARVYSIRIIKSIDLLFCMVLDSDVIEGDFPCTAIYREVHARTRVFVTPFSEGDS